MTDEELRTNLIRRRDPPSTLDDLSISASLHEGSSRTPSTSWRRTFARLLWPRRRCSCFSVKCCLLLVLTVLVLFLIAWKPVHHYFWEKNHATELSFLRHNECPACFGESMCRVLQDGAIRLDGMYQYPIFHSFNVRNVIHGLWRRGLQRDEPVVLKKLGHTTHIRSVHLDICFRVRGFEHKCHPRKALWSHLGSDGDEQVSADHARQSRADLSACLSDRLWDHMKQAFRERSTSPDSDVYLRHDQLMLLYAMKVNPEPLLLQSFPYDRVKWPFFPRYHGACGQWVVVEDRGETLASYVTSAGLSKRIEVAIQLLRMAFDLTEGRDDFRFYLGDASWENIVVDAATRISVIDLSNLMVVDRHETKRPGRPEQFYQAPFDPCSADNVAACHMTWDLERLCDVDNSDYNVYAVCRTFLSPSYANEQRPGGLLPDLVTHQAARGTEVTALLDRCARPANGESRLDIGKQLLALLRELHKAVQEGSD